MIRRQAPRAPCSMILIVIVMGIIAGVAIVMRDNMAAPAVEEPLSPVVLLPTTPAQTVITPTVPQPTPTDIPRQSVQLFIPEAEVAARVVPVFLDPESGSWNIRFIGGNVGHLEGTNWVNTPGNIVLAGHVELADGTPGIFANLAELNRGDQVLMQVDDDLRIYEIASVFTTPQDDLTVLYPTPNDQLTLITCTGYDLITNTYAERIVATAVRVS